MGQKTGEREGQIEELLGGQHPGSEAPPVSKKEQERREQRRCQERSDCQRNNVEGGCVRVIEGEEVRGDDPVKYFFPTGVRSTS